MKITGPNQEQQISQQLASIQNKSATKLTSARDTSSRTKSLDQSFAKLAEDAQKLEKMKDTKTIKDAAAYQEAVKQFASDYNQAFSQAKAMGGVEGQQVQRVLKRTAEQFSSGATGIKTATDGTLLVDETAAKNAYNSGKDKAAEVFKAATEKLSASKSGVHSLLSAKAKRLDETVDKQTHAQLSLSEASARLSTTYDAAGGVNTYPGFSSIYQLF